MLARTIRYVVGIAVAVGPLVLGCGGQAAIEECDPPGACSCEPGKERETSCSCHGGSTCSIQGDGIEFSCDGNASCDMECGADCLIRCPGTSSCEVTTGAGSIVRCPGTASCDVTCVGDCKVEVSGAADVRLTCAEDAECVMEGCKATECGDGVSVCRTDCPD